MQLKIRNDFDPVLSPESSLFVLKSNKQVSFCLLLLNLDFVIHICLWQTVTSQVAYQDILKILDPTKICSSVQNFIDIYLRLSGISANGQLTESDCIRVRICEGRFAVLIREVCFSPSSLFMLYSMYFSCEWSSPLCPLCSLLQKETLLFSQKLILISA